MHLIFLVVSLILFLYSSFIKYLACINSCCKPLILYKPITYFNRYELKCFNNEYFIYDNELTLYKDEVSGKWLKNFPRNNNNDFMLLYKENKTK